MTDIEFQFDDAHEFAAVLATAPTIIESEMLNAANRSALKGEQLAKIVAPSKTGHLRRSIAAEPAVFVGGIVTAKYGTATPYARWVEEGRGPVVPVNKKVLKFTIGGKVIFSKYAQPARGHWFMRASQNALRPLVPREFEAALQRIVEKVRQATG